MKYRELINELYIRRTKGIKLGLDRILSALEKFNNPHHSFRTIHIAGTNGKGSVSKIIYSLLKAHRLKVGLFTSPHLTRFTERIVVDEMEIPEKDVIRLIEKIKPYSEELTFFEYVTVMAFLYFQEKKVDYAVLETGMGGRLDATNVVKPDISVITSIGLDHQEFLGQDLASIAGEKAGIIKEGVPVVSSSQEREAEEVIIRKANGMKAPLFIYGIDFYSELKSMTLDNIVFDFYPSITQPSTLSLLPDFSLSLTGLHQMENASLALKSFMTIYPSWDEFIIREALKKVKIPGRLEVISKEPLVILDIAHNPQAASSLVKSLRIITEKKPVVVFGIMKDKDVNGILRQIEDYAEKILFTSPKYERALRSEELIKRLNGYSKNIQTLPDVATALREGLSICKKNSNLFLLCTGSAYLIGEIKETIGEKSSLRNLGELI